MKLQERSQKGGKPTMDGRNNWSQDIYTKAWGFAAKAHNGQKLPGTELPYIVHIGNVAMEIIACLALETVGHPNLAIQCALLHDVIEDTNVACQRVAEEFGPQVAAGVLALSKDKTLPDKRRRMRDSLARIKQQPPEVWMVKLADRITNLQPPPAYWNLGKIKRYRDEAILIYESLQEASPFLSSRLLKKIDEYSSRF